jgi:hypothetical protein
MSMKRCFNEVERPLERIFYILGIQKIDFAEIAQVIF